MITVVSRVALLPPHTAVQMALHNLAVTFAKEMRSLQLSEDQVTYWNQFMGTRQEHRLS